MRVYYKGGMHAPKNKHMRTLRAPVNRVVVWHVVILFILASCSVSTGRTEKQDYEQIKSVLQSGWNTIYEPVNNRVLSTAPATTPGSTVIHSIHGVPAGYHLIH